MKSEYKRLSHTIWLCKYHIIFCPKYRFHVLTGKVEVLVRNELYQLCRAKGIDIEEINIQSNHVHMILTVPPKHSISSVMGWLKGKVALKIFKEQKGLSQKYWGRHVWSRGYCVSTVGLDEEKIRKYVKWQQEKEQKG